MKKTIKGNLIYSSIDPGYGAMLLKFAKILGKENVIDFSKYNKLM